MTVIAGLYDGHREEVWSYRAVWMTVIGGARSVIEGMSEWDRSSV
jgi:hypothetical protein